MRFSQKYFLKFLPFKRMWLSFKLEFLQRKRTLFSLLTIIWHIANNGLSFQSKTCVFLKKAFFWNSYSFKRTCLSFKVDFLPRKRTLFSLLTILWHIPNIGFSIQRNTCAFLTKASHEIHTLSKEPDYLKSKASAEKTFTFLPSNNSLTYPK